MRRVLYVVRSLSLSILNTGYIGANTLLYYILYSSLPTTCAYFSNLYNRI